MVVPPASNNIRSKYGGDCRIALSNRSLLEDFGRKRATDWLIQKGSSESTTAMRPRVPSFVIKISRRCGLLLGVSRSNASHDVLRAASNITLSPLISFAVIINGPSAVVGIGLVNPYEMKADSSPTRFIRQCSGMSPSQSWPEGLSLGCGSRPAARAASVGSPRVTVREISAARFSCNRSMSVRFFATSVSIIELSRSRNSAIARCSSSGGYATLVARYCSASRF